MKVAVPTVLILGLAITACGPARVPVDPDQEALEIGTGSAQFSLLTDGAEIELVRGIQGGLHLDVAVRIAGVDPEGTRLSYAIHDVTTGERLDFDNAYALKRRRLQREDGRWLRLGDRAVLDTFDAGEVEGRQVELKGMLELQGRILEDRCDVTIVDRL